MNAKVFLIIGASALLSACSAASNTPSESILEKALTDHTNLAPGVLKVSGVKKVDGVQSSDTRYTMDFEATLEILEAGKCVFLPQKISGPRTYDLSKKPELVTPAKKSQKERFCSWQAEAVHTQEYPWLILGPNFAGTVSGKADFLKKESGWHVTHVTLEADCPNPDLKKFSCS